MPSFSYHVSTFILVIAVILPCRIGADPNCTLCVGDDNSTSSTLTSPSTIILNGRTCQSVYDGGALELSESNCAQLQELGENACGCNTNAINITANDVNNATSSACTTLCHDGSQLPQPFLEIIPNSSCAALQIDATWDTPDQCIYHQGVLGPYCGCNQDQTTTSSSTAICRLCQQQRNASSPLLLLPRPERVTTTSGLSCVQHEFRASLYQNCTEHQTLYADECCLDDVVPSARPSDAPIGDATLIPTTSPTETTSEALAIFSIQHGIFLLLAASTTVAGILWS